LTCKTLARAVVAAKALDIDVGQPFTGVYTIFRNLEEDWVPGNRKWCVKCGKFQPDDVKYWYDYAQKEAANRKVYGTAGQVRRNCAADKVYVKRSWKQLRHSVIMAVACPAKGSPALLGLQELWRVSSLMGKSEVAELG
jgi:hypothetical protein